jgi:hypothetical protein
MEMGPDPGRAPRPPVRLAVPDPAFTLTERDRQQVRAGVDAQALERLLSMVHPAYRVELLRFFTRGEDPQEARSILRMNDPVLQDAFEAVLAPARAAAGGSDGVERYRTARSAPVQIALVADFSIGVRDADAIVFHRAGGGDTVLLRDANADGTRLYAALRQLLRSRVEHGLTPAADHVITVRVHPDSDPPGGELYDVALRRLRETPLRPVAGIGVARTISFSFDESRK